MPSFIPASPNSHFPLENLPYGVFSPPGGGSPRVGVAIGDDVLDLAALASAGWLTEVPAAVWAQGELNGFMALGRPAWQAVRARLSHLLAATTPDLRDHPARDQFFYAQRAITLHLPARIGDYTDFYSSIHHATNVGTMLRGADNALQANWKHLPVGYHGRASSVQVSGAPVRRPSGQIKPAEAPAPVFAPTRTLDYELEIGFFVGPGNALGQPVRIDDAADHLFGLVLVNDWSARDLQAWEYQPLGPFLSKNFLTSISPWVVTFEALAPFARPLPPQDPPPLPYLQARHPLTFDIDLRATLNGMEVCTTNVQHLYWSFAQQLAHHTVNGCNLQPGDLLASGTISGPTPESRGCLLERTWRGSQPLTLPDGSTRSWLKDGDTLTLTGWAQGEGYRVGFGEVTGSIMP